jgi:hypothetical protein
MSDSISIRGTGATPRVGTVQNDDQPIRARRGTSGEGIPPSQARISDPGSIPVLPLPNAGIDALGDIAGKFLAMKLKTSDEQMAGSMKDVQDKGKLLKTKNEEISAKLKEAADKAAEAEKAKTAMKVLSWIAVALSVLFAVFTGGVGAIVGAAVAVTMATLNETGVMDKLTNAIAKSLEKGPPPMSEMEAKKTAGWIMLGISIAVSIATVGAGFASGASNVGGLAAKLPQIANAIASKVGTAVSEATARIMMEVAQKVITGTRIASALVSMGQGGAGIGGGIQRFAAADLQAQVVEDRAFLKRMQQRMEEEQDLIQAIMQSMSDMTSKVIETMKDQSDTMTEVLQHMRPQTG